MSTTDWKITVGDYVVYPTHGVGQISEITTDTVAGFEIEFLVIAFAKNRMTLKIPVDKIDISGLRKLSTESEIKKAMDIMKTAPGSKRMVWAKRSQEYEGKINSGEPSEIAEVVRDLYKRSDRPEQSFSERQIYEQAISRLADEYAVIFGLPSDDAVAKIEGLLDREDKKRVGDAEASAGDEDDEE